MPTLQEILDNDLGLGSEVTEKVASDTAEGDEIEKLAMEIGLIDNETAASPETETTKEAQMSLESLYEQAFPEDADISTQSTEKVAEETKEAADIEEAKGALAYGTFEGLVDGHITKIANAIIKVASDEEPPQTMDNDKVDSTAAIDTTPQTVDTHHEESHAAGDYEQKTSPKGPLKTASDQQAASDRKQWLISKLD